MTGFRGFDRDGHRFEVTLRATPEGRITSVEVDALTDVGAYPRRRLQ